MGDKPAEIEYVVKLKGGHTCTISRWSFQMRDLGYETWATAMAFETQGNRAGAAVLMRQLVLDTLRMPESELEGICKGPDEFDDIDNYRTLRDAIFEHEIKPMLDHYKAIREQEGSESPPAVDAAPTSSTTS